MQAGDLRHRLILQHPVEVQDATTGAINVTWTEAARIWGKIEPLSARDFISAQAEQSKITARIIIRYREGITAKLRFYHATTDTYYNIQGILLDKNSGQEYMTLPVSTIANKT